VQETLNYLTVLRRVIVCALTRNDAANYLVVRQHSEVQWAAK